MLWLLIRALFDFLQPCHMPYKITVIFAVANKKNRISPQSQSERL